MEGFFGGEEIIYATNRFMIYSLFPQCIISIHVLWGKQKQNTVFTIGKSIFDRSCSTDVGELALAYGGGGHVAAGTCQVDHEQANRVLDELITRIWADTERRSVRDRRTASNRRQVQLTVSHEHRDGERRDESPRRTKASPLTNESSSPT